jgi:hypothetical protein
MMNTPLDETATVRDLLFGDAAADATDTLTEELRETGAVRTVISGAPGFVAAAERQVASATDELLSLNLADVVVAGWKKYDRLRQAARSTRGNPNAREVVELATHNIESSHRPAVDVFLNGNAIATINIDLELTCTISGLIAGIHQGRLMEIQSGACTVTGSLAMQQITIVERQRKLDLPRVLRLRHGVPLLDPDTDDPSPRSTKAFESFRRPVQ